MSTLEGKIAFVTGASSGLGAETARLLSRRGATVLGIGRDAGRLGEVFRDVARGAYPSEDIEAEQDCRDAIERCVRELGCVDVLINIAGRHQMRRTESMTDDEW